MTTVIYRAGKLYADSRMKDYATGIVSDDAKKLFEPENLWIGERKILCMAVTGDSSFHTYCTLMDVELTKMNLRVDVTNPEFMQPIQDKLRDECAIVAVTASRVIGITITANGVSVVFDQPAPTAVLVAGTGRHVPGVVDTAMTVSAELAMADALAGDENSGGLVGVWTYGKKGVRMVDLRQCPKFSRWMTQKLSGVVYLRDLFAMVKARVTVYPKKQYV